MRRERCVLMRCQNEVSSIFIYTSQHGSKDMFLGLHEPTWWWGRPWQIAHVWTSLQKHISPRAISVNLRSILVLSKRGIQCNNHLHQMSCRKWNLALVSNFNTPSQLGRIPPANPSSIIMPSCCHVPSLSSHLYSAEPWCNNEEELIESES